MSDVTEEKITSAAYAQMRAGRTWLQDVERALTKFAKSGEQFQAADVRRWMQDEGMEMPTTPHSWGAIFNVWVREGRITAVDFVQSSNRSSNKSRVFSYVGTAKFRKEAK